MVFIGRSSASGSCEISVRDLFCFLSVFCDEGRGSLSVSPIWTQMISTLKAGGRGRLQSDFAHFTGNFFNSQTGLKMVNFCDFSGNFPN